MNEPNLLDRRMAFAILRVILGLNMLMRAVVRLPELGGFAEGVAAGFEETWLPSGFAHAYAYVIVFAELAIGALLLVGWQTRWALAGMGALLATLTFGMVLQQQFGTAANIMVYTLGVVFLLFNTRYDAFGVDAWRARGGRAG